MHGPIKLLWPASVQVATITSQLGMICTYDDSLDCTQHKTAIYNPVIKLAILILFPLSSVSLINQQWSCHHWNEAVHFCFIITKVPLNLSCLHSIHLPSSIQYSTLWWLLDTVGLCSWWGVVAILRKALLTQWQSNMVPLFVVLTYVSNSIKDSHNYIQPGGQCTVSHPMIGMCCMQQYYSSCHCCPMGRQWV